MKRFVLISYLLAFLFILAAATVPTRRETLRYVSTWTTLAPGATAVFTHALGTRPLIVQVWVTIPITEIPESVRPWTDLPGQPLVISHVSPKAIEISNRGDEALLIQVVAEQ